MAALPLPVSFGGAASPGRLFNRVAEAANWMAVPSGASSSGLTTSSKSALESPALKPGSAVATQLLSGDMDLSAAGTVTWVEGNSVLAFGHPFLSMGPVSMPMAQAEVLTVLPPFFQVRGDRSRARLHHAGPFDRHPRHLRDARPDGPDHGAHLVQ
jgi:hypothetical protein